jgi:chaperone modulatory protein CbpM
MTTIKTHYFSIDELCHATELSSHHIIEIVEHGIIEPEGTEPANWIFDTQMIMVTKKACRLHQDLGLNWQGIALAIELLDEMEHLKNENTLLKSRLRRFISE